MTTSTKKRTARTSKNAVQAGTESSELPQEQPQIPTELAQNVWSPDHLEQIPRPPENEFFVTPNDWGQTLFAILHALPLLIVGPSGCGKTELLNRAARAAQRTPESFNMGAMTDPRSSLIGVTHFNGGTLFQESRFIQTLRKPFSTIILDEINRAPMEAQNMLIPLLDDQRYIALDEAEDCAIVHPAEGVGFAATANIGAEYAGTTELDWAVMNRFQVVVQMDFMSASKECEILACRCPGINGQDAEMLSLVAQKQRAMWRAGEFAVPISTRSLLAAAKQCAKGVSLNTAVEYCLLNHFSSVGGLASDREKLMEVWKLTRT